MSTRRNDKHRVIPVMSAMLDSETPKDDNTDNEDPFKGCEAIIPEVDSESSSHTRNNKSVRSFRSKKSTRDK